MHADCRVTTLIKDQHNNRLKRVRFSPTLQHKVISFVPGVYKVLYFKTYCPSQENVQAKKTWFCWNIFAYLRSHEFHAEGASVENITAAQHRVHHPHKRRVKRERVLNRKIIDSCIVRLYIFIPYFHQHIFTSKYEPLLLLIAYQILDSVLWRIKSEPFNFIFLSLIIYSSKNEWFFFNHRAHNFFFYGSARTNRILHSLHK